MNIFATIVVLFFVGTMDSNASDFNFNVKTKPIRFLLLGPNIEIETKIGEQITIAPVIYRYRFMPLDFETKVQYETIQYDIGLNAYYYLDKALSSGFFLSPFLHYMIETKDSYTTAQQAKNPQLPKRGLQRYSVVGATVGYQWFTRGGFTSGVEAGYFFGIPLVAAGVAGGYTIGMAF